MDLPELRSAVLDYLDAKVSTDVFTGEAQLDRLINIAYVEMVNKVDAAAMFYNLSPVVPTLTTPGSSVAREYGLDNEDVFSPVPSDVIRKIVDCARIVNGKPVFVRIVPFAKRNAWLGRPDGHSYGRSCGRSNPVPITAVYFYRDQNGVWYLGFVDTEPPTGTQFEVRYRPEIPTLVSSDIPYQVPLEWHHLIALRAALIVKAKENRDMKGLAGFYVEELSDMQRDLASAVSLPQVQVL